VKARELTRFTRYCRPPRVCTNSGRDGRYNWQILTTLSLMFHAHAFWRSVQMLFMRIGRAQARAALSALNMDLKPSAHCHQALATAEGLGREANSEDLGRTHCMDDFVHRSERTPRCSASVIRTLPQLARRKFVYPCE
jgi:hypothetical protein